MIDFAINQIMILFIAINL